MMGFDVVGALWGVEEDGEEALKRGGGRGGMEKKSGIRGGRGERGGEGGRTAVHEQILKIL